MSSAYEKLMDRVKDAARLESIAALLDWDQETYMPEAGVSARADQISLVSGLRHDTLVCDETRALIEEADAKPDDHVATTNLREVRRVFDRESKIPTELVKEIAHTTTLAKQAWARARERDDFGEFAPLLTKVVTLKRRVVDLIGYETDPYDALMDEFEPGAKAAEVEAVFEDLVAATVKLLDRIREATHKPDPGILHGSFPRAGQETLSRKMAEHIRFDSTRGRADVSVHPFCTTIGGSDDVRITTRYDEGFLSPALFGTLHEVGHALYEQGLDPAHRFTPMGEATSLGIHESQSRLWENLVGRSRVFWECHFEAVQRLFPDALGGVTLDAFHGALNAVTPSLIRVEADEVTYNLHIVLRFEIERALIDGSLDTADLPRVWNEKFTEYFGITPPTNREGCLQDIHWSIGALGYFPTYALGNLYAAQFFQQAGRDIPDLDARILANDHGALLDWLRTNIHRHGRRFRAAELVERVTGKPLSIEPYMSHVESNCAEVYGI
jgi:carboxypeptidase Taq